MSSDESNEMLIPFSVVVKFYKGFSVNGFLIQLYPLISSGKFFIKWLLTNIKWSEIVIDPIGNSRSLCSR